MQEGCPLGSLALGTLPLSFSYLPSRETVLALTSGFLQMRRGSVALPCPTRSSFLLLDPSRETGGHLGAPSSITSWCGPFSQVLPLSVAPFPLCQRRWLNRWP